MFWSKPNEISEILNWANFELRTNLNSLKAIVLCNVADRMINRKGIFRKIDPEKIRAKARNLTRCISP